MRKSVSAKANKRRASQSHQRGVTLIELLVALVIGLFLVVGMLQVFVGSRQSLDVIRAQSSMQEAARFGFNFMAKATRQAGYLNAGAMTNNDLFAAELVNKFQMVEYSEDLKPWVDEIWAAQDNFVALGLISGEDNFSGAVAGIDVAADSDVLRVRLQGDPDGLMADCEGVDLTTDSDLYVNMTFFISEDDQLYCRVFDGAANRSPVALVAGIENMQIQYGVATDPGSRFVVTQYVTGGDVVDWTRVMTVRVAILAVSDNEPLDRSAQQYDLLDEEGLSFSDGKARQVFTQTIALRGNLSNG